MSIILGTHNGINLIRKEDGSEFYYSTKTKKTAIGIKGLSRLLGCHTTTVSNAVVKLEAGRKLEMYTQSSMERGQVKEVHVIMEEDLPKVLTELSNGRTKKETRLAATKLLEKLAQAGFRLMVLLEVAPEEVAKEAINNIEDVDKTRKVFLHAEQHQKYLESYHGVHDGLKAHGATSVHHAVVNSYNNQLIGLENGRRKQMGEFQKDAMTFIQIAEKLSLGAKEIDKPNQAVDLVKNVGLQAQQALANILKSI